MSLDITQEAIIATSVTIAIVTFFRVVYRRCKRNSIPANTPLPPQQQPQIREQPQIRQQPSAPPQPYVVYIPNQQPTYSYPQQPTYTFPQQPTYTFPQQPTYTYPYVQPPQSYPYPKQV